MEYSKISTVELINFMSFKRAKVAFDESGIVNIKGYNDSGKSAILRGLVVCLMDMFKQKQAKFIRYGEEYFRVVVTFNDGVSIIRDKYINGQSLYEVYKGNECIFTTKQGNKLSKVDGVPKPIQDYLGLCVTDSVYLNYQSCLDKLPVVDTTGGENYQMFHEVLRMEEIYRASNMINTDKNELGSRISGIEYEIQRTEVLLEKCGDVTQEFIDTIEDLEKRAEALERRKSSVQSIKELLASYSSIVSIPEISKVSSERLSEIQGIQGIVSSLEGITSLPEVQKVSSDRLEVLKGIEDSLKHIDGFISIPEVPMVDRVLVDRRVMLGSIAEAFNSFYAQSMKCKGVKEELSSKRIELKELMNSAKSKGFEFVKCENCGTYSLVGGGHSHE